MQSLFIPYLTLSYLLYSASGALGARIETPLCQHIEWMCRTLLMPTVNATTCKAGRGDGKIKTFVEAD